MKLFRAPDFVIGPHDNPYMLRWYLIPRNRWCNVYLHKIVRSDDDRALHDHPWWSVSFFLSGEYTEISSSGMQVYGRGSVIFRRAVHRHRLVLNDGQHAWTLFITGPKVRDWGFWCPRGFVPWHEFVAIDDRGQVGRGCGEMEKTNAQVLAETILKIEQLASLPFPTAMERRRLLLLRQLSQVIRQDMEQ